VSQACPNIKLRVHNALSSIQRRQANKMNAPKDTERTEIKDKCPKVTNCAPCQLTNTSNAPLCFVITPSGTYIHNWSPTPLSLFSVFPVASTPGHEQWNRSGCVLIDQQQRNRLSPTRGVRPPGRLLLHASIWVGVLFVKTCAFGLKRFVLPNSLHSQRQLERGEATRSKPQVLPLRPPPPFAHGPIPSVCCTNDERPSGKFSTYPAQMNTSFPQTIK
jgi:hypothetical protein